MKNSLDFLSIEQKLIEDIKGLTGEQYIGDDCAILPGQLLVTSDMLVEGTHFTLKKINYNFLGWKAVAVNLSDIAAMAGRPRYLLANISFPDSLPDKARKDLFKGIVNCANTYRTRLVGGDLTNSDLLTISITVIGDEHENGVLKRTGATVGDVVVVTGDFGSSAAGLYLLCNEITGYNHCYEKHCRPQPRLCESWALVRNTGCQGALMDASDGLADSLTQICRMSKVGMEIDYSKIPVHHETKNLAKLANVNLFDWVFYGGEDYELVACLSQEKWQQMKQLSTNPFIEIGKVVKSNNIIVLTGKTDKIELDLSKIYQHWS
jgi:thiamine-monophosphate kinase